MKDRQEDGLSEIGSAISSCRELCEAYYLEMSRMHTECPDPDPSDRWISAHVRLRQEPDEDDDEEEDDSEEEDDDADDDGDDGYSE